MIIIKKLN